mgnify:CR=1 FL=1
MRRDDAGAVLRDCFVVGQSQLVKALQYFRDEFCLLVREAELLERFDCRLGCAAFSVRVGKQCGNHEALMVVG